MKNFIFIFIFFLPLGSQAQFIKVIDTEKPIPYSIQELSEDLSEVVTNSCREKYKVWSSLRLAQINEIVGCALGEHLDLAFKNKPWYSPIPTYSALQFTCVSDLGYTCTRTFNEAINMFHLPWPLSEMTNLNIIVSHITSSGEYWIKPFAFSKNSRLKLVLISNNIEGEVLINGAPGVKILYQENSNVHCVDDFNSFKSCTPIKSLYYNRVF